MPPEGQLLVALEMLAGEDEHGVAIHRCRDRRDLAGIQRTSEIEAFGPRGEEGMERRDAERGIRGPERRAALCLRNVAWHRCPSLALLARSS